MVSSQVQPFLMFEGNAEEAMNLYVSLFADGEVLAIERYGPGEASVDGSIKVARFRIGGQTVMCIDSPAKHDFSFTPAFSFFVEFESEDEQSRIYGGLVPGGSVFMPMGNYGFSRSFAWISDTFGVSWQLSVP